MFFNPALCSINDASASIELNETLTVTLNASASADLVHRSWSRLRPSPSRADPDSSTAVDQIMVLTLVQILPS